MSDDEKLQAVLDYLTDSHLDSDGGYPYDYEWVGKKLVVAELDHDGATSIRVFTRRELLRWHNRATRFLKNEPDEDFKTALQETEPVAWNESRYSGCKIDEPSPEPEE